MTWFLLWAPHWSFRVLDRIEWHSTVEIVSSDHQVMRGSTILSLPPFTAFPMHFGSSLLVNASRSNVPAEALTYRLCITRNMTLSSRKEQAISWTPNISYKWNNWVSIFQSFILIFSSYIDFLNSKVNTGLLSEEPKSGPLTNKVKTWRHADLLGSSFWYIAVSGCDVRVISFKIDNEWHCHLRTITFINGVLKRLRERETRRVDGSIMKRLEWAIPEGTFKVCINFDYFSSRFSRSILFSFIYLSIKSCSVLIFAVASDFILSCWTPPAPRPRLLAQTPRITLRLSRKKQE